jgi:hypothetical protein
MATTFDTPVAPYAEQVLEASTRAINATAELYTEVLTSQAEATRALLDLYGGLGTAAVTTATDTAGRTEETAVRATENAARTTARATRRTTKRAAQTTRRAAQTTRRAAQSTRRAAAKPATPPITGYDDLTADEIVAKLPEQPQTALAAIAAYEQATTKRATVLQRVAALSGPEPAPGYDELNADDAQKLVTGGSAELAAAVRDYERRHKDRASVIEAATRHADAS